VYPRGRHPARVAVGAAALRRGPDAVGALHRRQTSERARPGLPAGPGHSPGGRKMTKGRRHETTVAIAATPETVWEALTTAGGLRRGFALDGRTTAGLGARVGVSGGEGMAFEYGNVRVLEPLRRVEWAGEMRGVELATEFIIESHGGKTTLRI